MNDPNKLYRLVFTGNLLPGHSRRNVIARLQRLLKLDQKKAEILVSGKHRQINKKLTLDRAEKLRLMIIKQGAECVLLPVNEESFVTTQQLPMFIHADKSAQDSNADGHPPGTVSERLNKNIPGDEIKQQSITSLRMQGRGDISRNIKLKYLFYGIFFMILEGIIIWQLRAPEPCNCGNAASVPVTGAARAGTVRADNQQAVADSGPVDEVTERRIRNLVVRTSLWFAGNRGASTPSEISWHRIQEDLGISTSDMTDSRGNAIRYAGKNDSYEFRSPGADGRFYTGDDIYLTRSVE
jgi:hypothetical protein